MCYEITVTTGDDPVIIREVADPTGACQINYDPATGGFECTDMNCDGMCRLFVEEGPGEYETTAKCCCGENPPPDGLASGMGDPDGGVQCGDDGDTGCAGADPRAA